MYIWRANRINLDNEIMLVIVIGGDFPKPKRRRRLRVLSTTVTCRTTPD